MAYEAPITIKKAIDKIRKKKYVLPSIQREFVWDTYQIEMLFDSLMRDYPISTFLFWNVDKSKIKDFQFYEFLNNYHRLNGRHNKKADLSSEEDVIAVLDGQQRMTSMYIGLTGSFSERQYRRRKNNPNSYPKMKLYLNLLKRCDDVEFEYDFSFLTEHGAQNKNGNYWFECGEILKFDDIKKVMKYLIANGLTDTSKHTPEECDFALESLSNLFNIVHQKETINYYQEEDETLDKVLQIFIRINSGGTKLSYSDLLLSIATAQWQEKDAREVIHEFVDDINSIGAGFNFNKDFVLKACLVLADFRDIKFKVDNFKKENMLIIEENWDNVSTAIKSAIQLVAKFGYSRDSLTANNAIIPIAYYIYKNNLSSLIIQNNNYSKDRINIREWLARVIIKGTFGGTPDGLYPAMRDLINNNPGCFPLEQIIEKYRGKRKSIIFTEDDIDNLLDLDYGKARTFCVLSLLYSSLNMNYQYHQDHIHPKSLFKQKKLKELGLTDEQIDIFKKHFNKLPNLQLLEATQNIQKSDMQFKDWLDENYSDPSSRNMYLLQNYIDADVDLDLTNFEEFYDRRYESLKSKLSEILNVTVEEEFIEDEVLV